MAATGSSRTPSDIEPAAAIEALNALCLREPASAAPRVALAEALLRASRAAEALIPAEQAVAMAPELAAAVAAREAVIAALQAGDPNLVKLEMTAVLDPGNAAAHLALGEAYAASDRAHDAERHFKRALALGLARDAHADLATLYLSVSMHEAAEYHALAVLAGEDRGAPDDTVMAMALQTLASILKARGDHAGGERRLDQAYARQSLFRQPAADSPFTSLVLVTRHQGNVPYAWLMPAQRFDRVIWYMEHARPEQVAKLSPYDVVVNAIGDADIAVGSRAAVDGFLSHNTRPVLNPPDRVSATFRDQIGETLRGLDNVIVPRTIRLPEARIANEGLGTILAAAGLETPILLRPAGSHGGAGLMRIDGEPPASTDAPGDGDVYISQFHDYRSVDGYYRKYRVIFVAGRAFPYHLAIGPHWMVHHQTAEMANDPRRKTEELRFLNDPAAAIGTRAMAAIDAIGRRLNLDYGGIDFAVTDGGQVLVFEANATMLTHLEPEDGPFADKNPFIRPIIDAFQARLTTLALAGGA